MQPGLLDIVVSRLSEAGPDPGTEALVLAACEGPEVLEGVCGGATPPLHVLAASADEAEPPGTYLKSVTVEGFRGVGPPLRLDLAPGPGLTVIVGRNGSGKSSLAEATELVLTGDNRRWSGRPKVWSDDWRNLHHAERASVRAELSEEGQSGPTVVERSWQPGEALEKGQSFAQRPGKPRAPVEALGWRRPLEYYRPILSHNELGSMLDGPSKLYDTLSKILGLEELVAAEACLRDARLSRDKQIKAAKAELDLLLPRLEELDDTRAIRAVAALTGRSWDLEAVEGVATGVDEDVDPTSELVLLRQLSSLTGPDPDVARRAADELRLAARAVRASAGTDAARSRHLIQLLGAALDHHTDHGDEPCPVCGQGHLDDDWRTGVEQHLVDLREASRAAEDAHQRLRGAVDSATRLADPPPAVLTRCAELGLDAEDALSAWMAWSQAPADEPDALADHLASTVDGVNAALTQLRESAAAELARRDDVWRPLARELATWLAKARAAEAAGGVAARLRRAEQWIKAAAGDIRDERFAPIADHSRAVWERLRQQSNIDLGRIAFAGSANSRRVVLDVTVDGVAGAALGVMSQGELNCLALSLFLPRATLAESPFRFLVIDDPVQAMDPARVDGLARVLEQAAATRQVIVLSHDDRLPEAIRRLGIAATILEVTRRANSVVELRSASTPAGQAIDDAMALARTSELPPQVAGRVVPGFCRLAIEAACTEVVRRRRIGRGEPHGTVEHQLQAAHKMAPRLALVLFDDATRAGEVPTAIEARFGRSKKDAYFRVNHGAHEGESGDLVGLVRNCERLVADLMTVA